MERIRLTKINYLENQVLQTGSELSKLSFKDRFRIKCHLSAGAHGIILWAIDRCCMNSKNIEPINFSPSNLKDNCQNCQKCKDQKEQYIRQYAIKRIFIRNRNIPIKLIREIKSLQFLKGHSNVSQNDNDNDNDK